MYNMLILRNVLLCGVLIFLQFFCKAQAYQDVEFYSKAFTASRYYRIYLPKSYDRDSEKRYPVVYYFHGYGGRYKWDTYTVEDDVFYPENGRKSPPYVMEWSDYVQDHEVIIVTWDGYEPNNHPGRNFREGLTYGGARPYDYDVAHATESKHWGWDYRMYFRDLVHHVDGHFRTIPDRQYRAITGLSMGGQTAYYIAGQSKDLVSAVSAFDPADNIAMQGPKGRQVAIPVLEMFRSLEGLKIRLTMTDGDWLKYNDWKMKRIFQTAYPDNFSFHMATYPDHWAADIPEQLDFHMKNFEIPAPIPVEWNHISPFPSFEVLGYSVAVESNKPPIVLMERLAPDVLKVRCKPFIPDGPILRDDKITIMTPAISKGHETFEIINYNIASDKITRNAITSSESGNLHLSLDGGGHIIGLNNKRAEQKPMLQLATNLDQTYFYYEEGVRNSLDLKLINLGLKTARHVVITATSADPYIDFIDSLILVDEVASGERIDLQKVFDFSIRKYVDTVYISSLNLEISVDGAAMGTRKIFFYPVPQSPYIPEGDIFVLDGRTVKDVPIFRQGPNEVQYVEISGGQGNGNGILESGEEVLLYVKLPQGMAPNDVNTFHRTQLMNHQQNPYMTVETLDYLEKFSQAGATSVATPLTLSEDCPRNQELDLWLKVESLYNDKDDPTSNATIYAQKAYYRKVKLKVNVR